MTSFAENEAVLLNETFIKTGTRNRMPSPPLPNINNLIQIQTKVTPLKD